MEIRFHECPVCGAAEGSCSDIASAPIRLPLQVAIEPEGLGMPKKHPGKFFHTPVRVFRNDRLIYGAETDIPWDRAIELGLVEDDTVEMPVAVEPTPEQIAATEVEVPEGENLPALVEATDVTAAIRKRPKKNPSAKLSNVS